MNEQELKIFEENTGLIGHCMKYFKINPQDRDAINQEGAIALINAIREYDSTKNGKFSSYACNRIRWAISDYFVKQGEQFSVKLTRKDTRYYYKILQFKYDYQEKYGKFPTKEEISEGTGISLNNIRIIDKVTNDIVFLNQQLMEDKKHESNNKTNSDTLVFEDDSYENMILKEALKQELETLDKEYKQYIDMYFFQGLTQPQIAKIMGVNQAHVSRRIRRGVEIMRKNMGIVA